MINRLHKCACLSFYNNVRKCALEITHSLCNILSTLWQWIVRIFIYQYDFDSNHKNRFRFRVPRRPIVTFYNNNNTLSYLIKTNNSLSFFNLFAYIFCLKRSRSWNGVRINGFRTREIDITKTRSNDPRLVFFYAIWLSRTSRSPSIEFDLIARECYRIQ